MILAVSHSLVSNDNMAENLEWAPMGQVLEWENQGHTLEWVFVGPQEYVYLLPSPY